MNKNKFISLSFLIRLGMFLALVPLILFLIFVNFKNYIFINIVVLIFSGLAAQEVNDLLRKKSLELPNILSFFLGLIPSILTYIHFNFFYLDSWIIFFLLVVIIFSNWIVSLIFLKEDEIINFLSKAMSIIFILIYPGVLMSFIVAITTLPKAPILMSVLFLMVSGNDTFAYIFGYFFGKNSRKPIIISPNKTVIGFLGGIFFSILIAVLSVTLGFLSMDYWEAIIFGTLIGFFTIMGDLFESGLKRSVGVKDSGNVIPGRGGALDSVDSFLFAGPIFYFYLA